LLVSKDIIKVADFGLVREINSQPPFTEYRAPEVLLQSPTYGPAVDMLAMGAIMAEFFTLFPLLPGSSINLNNSLFFGCCEADEIYKICCVIGSPTKNKWPEGLELASGINYQFPKVSCWCQSLLLIPGVSEDAINLITSLCSWDPCKRPTALEVLQHPFFQSCYYVPPSLHSKAAVASTPPANTRVSSEHKYGRRYPGGSLNPKPVNNFSSAKPLPTLKCRCCVYHMIFVVFG
ncbi:cyclin-dependent kinase F-4-like isoform X1, partial [Olea europaea subsp. europaea]